MPCGESVSRRLSNLVLVFSRGLAVSDRFCPIQFSQAAVAANDELIRRLGFAAIKAGWAVCALPAPIAATIAAAAPAHESHGQAEVFIGEDHFLKTAGQSERKPI